MRTTVEPLEGNKVKLSVEVDEEEFEKAIDAAFRKIAREVRIPGFRPGKAPRRLLEARIGTELARQEALRDALPEYYLRAVREQDIDAIAPPKIDITAGEESGGVAFDAVVEVRPHVSVAGYEGMQVTIPNPEVTEEDVDRQIDRLRHNFGELRPVARPAQPGDHLTIDITATHHTETLDERPDYLYELGSGAVVPELDEQLRGARPGDILKFNAPVPGHDDGVTFTVLVKEVKEKVLPEVTDEWAQDASEFDTVAELRAELRRRVGRMKRLRARMALVDAVIDELVKLVDDAEVPESLVTEELERRIHDLGHRLEAQGVELARYLEAVGRSQEELLAELRAQAVNAVKADLALRAVADAEGLEVTDDDVEAEVRRIAERFGRKPAEVRRQLDRTGGLAAVRSDIRKTKALDWLVGHVEVVDEEGRPIDRSVLEEPTEPEPEVGADLSLEEAE
jgi:trigger factor